MSSGTIAARFRVSYDVTPGNSIFILSNSNQASTEARLYVDHNGAYNNGIPDLGFHVRDNGINRLSAVLPANLYDIFDEMWHYVAVTMDENGIKMYLDGEEVDPTFRYGSSISNYWFDSIDGLDKMHIGRNIDNGGPQWYFDGDLDAVSIWDMELYLS